MSNESFQAFLAKIQDDEDLKREVQAAGGDDGVPMEAMAAIAASRGYEFTAEDISSELEDAELEGVSGGTDLLMYKMTPALKDVVLYKMDVSRTSVGTVYFKFF